jgi:4-amino-4-deoxy-L-arabinose transferase-like glycosyltransferase
LADRRTTPSIPWEAAFLSVAVVLVSALALYRLEVFPLPFFDEGWYLQVPRNLVEHGEYATRSADGFRHDDTVLSVSPTMYFPIAAAFAVGGIGFLQARLVMVAYLLAAVAACYLLSRRVYGPVVAGAATYLFLFRMEGDPFTSTLLLGRQVMGEVPAMAFVLTGCLVWRSAALAGRTGLAALAGVILGLSFVTKLQWVFFVPTALVVVAAIAWWHGQRRHAWLALVAVVAAGLTLVAWFLCLWAILGTGHATSLVANVVAASAPQVRIGAFAAVSRSLSFLAGSTFLVVGVPAIVYALVLEIRDPAPDPGRRLLVAIIAMSALWFTFRSIGWPRYAYPMLALSNLLVAKLFYDLAAGLAVVLRGPAAAPMRAATATGSAFAIVALVVLALPLAHARPAAKALLGPPDHSLSALHDWMDRELPPDALVETWEFEVAVAPSAHRYNFPPVRFVDRMIANVFLGTADEVHRYQPPHAPAYLVLGRFGKWTGLYAPALSRAGEALARFGEYDVYRLPAAAPPD